MKTWKKFRKENINEAETLSWKSLNSNERKDLLKDVRLPSSFAKDSWKDLDYRAKEILGKYINKTTQGEFRIDEAWTPDSVTRNAEIGSKKGYGINIKKGGGVTKTPFKHMLLTTRKHGNVRVTFDHGKDEFEGTPQSVALHINQTLGIKESVELDEVKDGDIEGLLKWYDNSEEKKVYDILKKNGFRLPAESFTLVQNMIKKHKNVKKAADEIIKKYPQFKESVELDEALTLASDDLSAVKKTAQKLARQSPDRTYYVVQNTKIHGDGKMKRYEVVDSVDMHLYRQEKRIIGYGKSVKESVEVDEGEKLEALWQKFLKKIKMRPFDRKERAKTKEQRNAILRWNKLMGIGASYDVTVKESVEVDEVMSDREMDRFNKAHTALHTRYHKQALQIIKFIDSVEKHKDKWVDSFGDYVKPKMNPELKLSSPNTVEYQQGRGRGDWSFLIGHGKVRYNNSNMPWKPKSGELPFDKFMELLDTWKKETLRESVELDEVKTRSLTNPMKPAGKTEFAVAGVASGMFIKAFPTEKIARQYIKNTYSQKKKLRGKLGVIEVPLGADIVSNQMKRFGKIKVVKESVELDEDRWKTIPGKEVAKRMKAVPSMKPYAAQVAKLKKVNAIDLERLLPHDKVSVKDIDRVMFWKESVEHIATWNDAAKLQEKYETDKRIPKMSDKGKELLAWMANSFEMTGGPHLDKKNVHGLSRHAVDGIVKKLKSLKGLPADKKKDMALVMKELGEGIEEEISTTTTSVGTLTDPTDMGKKKKKKRCAELDKYTDSQIFTVSSEDFNRCSTGRRKNERWSKFFASESEQGANIKKYSLRNPKSPIIIKNEETGDMMFLRRRLNDQRLKHNKRK